MIQKISLIWLISLVAFSEAVLYTIIIETGTSSGAGTDYNIEIRLHGISRQTGVHAATSRLKLDKSQNHANKFEMGKTDTFIGLQDAEDLINIKKIEIRMTGSSVGPEWQLKKVTILTEKKEKYEFSGNIWLKKKDVSYLITSVPSTNVLPIAPVTKPKVNYIITVKTGNVHFAETNSKVYIKIFGLSRTTRLPKAITPTQLTGAVAGDIFSRGSVKIFTIQDEEDLTALSKIEVMRDGGGNDWYLEEISVATQNGEKYKFPVERWIKNPNQYFLFKVPTYAQYTIIVETGTSLGAGTDCNVAIRLHGISRETGKHGATRSLILEKSENNKNKFEKGKTDTFKNLQDTHDLININKIEIKMSGFSLGQAWQLSKVTIMTAKGERYEFSLNNMWLKKTGVSYLITSVPSVNVLPVQPVNPVTIRKVKYIVTVKTGNVLHAETNSKVYIKIFGLSRKTKQHRFTTPIQLTGVTAFSRGSVNTFTIEDEKDLMTLSKIEVMRDSSGNNWYLEDISVASQDGEKYEFPVKTWIKNANQYFEFKVTTLPQYTIIVETGASSGAGTDCNIEIRLHGISRQTGVHGATSRLKLDKSENHENKFERTHTDTFKNLQDTHDLININKIEIRMSGFSAGPEWQLKKVTIITGKGERYEFSAHNLWFKKTDVSYLITSVPSVNVLPVTPVTKPKVKYTIIVKTGDVTNAETKSKVYIKIFGLSRKTKHHKVTTPTQLTGAVTGGVFSRASVNTFTIEDEEDLTMFSKIEVMREGDKGDYWYLEDISVTTQNGERYVFSAKEWIRTVNQYFVFKVTTYTQYTIIVETGSSPGAGTDCSVGIRLHGISRKTGVHAATSRLKLEKSENHVNKFEMAHTDTFNNLQDTHDLININKIEIKMSGFSVGPEWQLKRVTIVTSKGERYTFSGNIWLKKTDISYLISSVPSVNVLPVNPVTIPKVKYTIIVRTGDVKDAETNSKVFIKIFGLSRKTKQPKAITPTQLTGAVAGDVFLRASVNTFFIEDEEDLTTLNKIEVMRDNRGDNWYLEDITVITRNRERYEFSARRWINHINQYFYFQVTTLPQYTIIVETGTSFGAGTDCNVEIRLLGISRKTGAHAATSPLKLEKSENNENKFELGKTDTFKNLQDTHDLVNIDKVEIRMSGFSVGAAWQLRKVTIITGKGERYEFIGNIWLKKTGISYLIISSSNVNVVPVPSVTVTKVKYTVIVKTGDVKFAETNSKVYIKIFGLSRKTKHHKVTTPTQLTGAVAGDVILRASVNKFTIEDEEDLTTLNKIEIMRDSKGNDWYLEEITIITQNGEKYVFPAKTWINNINQCFVFKVTVVQNPQPPGPPTPAPLPPSPTPSKTGVEYSIIVYTDSVAKAGTRAQVYMTFIGVLATSSEIHLKSSALETRVQTAGSKIFRVKAPDVGHLRIIRIRQDVSAGSPNWNINKVLVIQEHLTVYEFIVGSWLGVSVLEKSLSDSYPATSLKFIGYTPCVQPVESKIHPNPASNVVILRPCGRLQNFFKLQPDGVIQHLSSGMCIQGIKNGDPVNTAHGDRVTLNYPCTLYRPGYNTPHAFQFKFTNGGSLMEIKSGKCISVNKGQKNVPLTFSSTCDTADTIVGFIDKRNKVIEPKSTGKSPTGKSPGRAPPGTPGTPSTPGPPSTPGQPSTPGPPSTPGTPSTQTPGTQTVPEVTMPNNYGSPVYCQSTCGQPSCSSTCQPACCNGPQQPGVIPAGFPPIVRCPSFCSPGQCRSECPVGCCFPNWDSQQAYRDKENAIEIINSQRYKQ